MCPGFDSRTRRQMWVEFVVGSRPCSPGSPVFLPPQKSTFLNSNSIRNSRATGLSVSDCYVLLSLNKVDYYLLLLFGERSKKGRANLKSNTRTSDREHLLKVGI